MKQLLIACLLASALACNTSTSSTQLTKKWMLHSVVRNGNDVTEKHNPHSERWIEFLSDSTFASGGRPFGDNTGRWKLVSENEQQTLYIYSSAGDDDDSSWIIQLTDSSWSGSASKTALPSSLCSATPQRLLPRP